MTEPASTGPADTGPAGPVRPDNALLRLPAALAEQAREVLSGREAPATPRDAASVLLLRPAAAVPARSGIEVYMLRRARSMAFAAGVFAFPGGSVDPRDSEEEGLAWAGPDPDEWGRALDAPAALARALVCAAVRETFEESGVVVAGPEASSVVGENNGTHREADRGALLDHS
ncbi:MAG: hypothetical protein ACR2MP_33750, partial [Streptosporangiaceae bacterium]